jgi:hypothetical protein
MVIVTQPGPGKKAHKVYTLKDGQIVGCEEMACP